MFASLIAVAMLAPAPAHPALRAPMTLSVHRFGKGEAPEGTVEAARNAAALGPNVILECDVRLAKDGHVVVVHDDTLTRTTGNSGRPEAMTLEEIRRLDAGAFFSPDQGATRPWRGKGVRIATLPEALAAAPRNRFLLDLKEPGPLVEAVLRDVRAAGAEDRVIYAAFQGETLRQVRRLAPSAPTSFDLETGAALARALRGDWGAYVPPAQVLAADASQFRLLGVGEAEVRRVREKGIRVIVFVLDRPEDLREWMAKGVDGVMTSYPSMGARVLSELGKWPAK